ncbi:L,D-transpeptidase family protein [Alicyclobacillus fastidiosus]|uniref:L,D-transpeptidase family protein n=1 Tax=Alicyclobacillus fastidiosus TaxID=392011 RepID=A0ABV5ABN7_9BACL|nr:L,D-transpeptidase family protein [Alicyclobacillus fastidiosus]WEH10350.1 L,D-transpeptidase family protein [Alicyclobacillus fastidiosus]
MLRQRLTWWRMLLGLVAGSLVCVRVMAAVDVPREHVRGQGQYMIQIDTAHPLLKVYRAGELYRTYKVALGKSDTQTPIGEWRIVEKHKDWGGGFGTRWLGLNVPWGTYGIHGTNRPTSIGSYASHGCVRMNNQDVEQLYDMIPVGTPVTIQGDPLAHLRVLEYGNIGADVQLVQKRLREAGYYDDPCHGKFDAPTQFSLIYFQLTHDLPMDGQVTIDDYRALGLAASARGKREVGWYKDQVAWVASIAPRCDTMDENPFVIGP